MFVDITKVLNAVNALLTWIILKNIGGPEKFVNTCVIGSLHTHIKMQVKLKDHLLEAL